MFTAIVSAIVQNAGPIGQLYLYLWLGLTFAFGIAMFPMSDRYRFRWTLRVVLWGAIGAALGLVLMFVLFFLL